MNAHNRECQPEWAGNAAILDTDAIVIIAPQRLAVDALRHLASGVPVVAVEGSVPRHGGAVEAQPGWGRPTSIGSPQPGWRRNPGRVVQTTISAAGLCDALA